MTGEEALNELRRLAGDDGIGGYADLNRALRRYCRTTGFPWLREIEGGAFTFTTDEAEVLLSDLGLRRISRIWVKGSDSGKWHELDEATELTFEEARRERLSSDGTDDTGRPKKYLLSQQPGSGGTITSLLATPTPDEDYEGRVDGIVTTPVISRLGQLPGPEEYHDLVPRLAAGYVLQDKARKLLQDAQSEVAVVLSRELRADGRAIEAQALAEIEAFAVRDSMPNRLSTLQWSKTPIAK